MCEAVSLVTCNWLNFVRVWVVVAVAVHVAHMARCTCVGKSNSGCLQHGYFQYENKVLCGAN